MYVNICILTYIFINFLLIDRQYIIVLFLIINNDIILIENKLKKID